MTTSYAEEFNKAIKSGAVNENAIVSILSNLSSEERLKLRQEYKEKYGHPIQEDINDTLSFKLKDLTLAMFDSQYEFDARELHRALHSFINDDKTICEIFASRPKEHLCIVNEAYKQFYDITLREDIQKETGKEYCAFLLAIMDTPRPEGSTLDKEGAFEVVRNIKGYGLKSYGKDVNLFKSVFLEKSREDLINISRAYNTLEGINFFDAIKTEVGGKNCKLLKAILFAVTSPSEYFSKKVYKAIRGLGTDANALYRIIISRSEIDMDIMRDYYYIFRKTSIKEDILGDLSGSYGQILANLSLKLS